MPSLNLTVKTCVGSQLFDGHTLLSRETRAISMQVLRGNQPG